MACLIAPLFLFVAAPAFAHPGFHPNPHGIEYGWLAAALIGAVAAWLWQAVRK